MYVAQHAFNHLGTIKLKTSARYFMLCFDASIEFKSQSCQLMRWSLGDGFMRRRCLKFGPRTTGIVTDPGDGTSPTVSIFEGYVQFRATLRMNVHVSDYLMKILSEQEHYFDLHCRKRKPLWVFAASALKL